MAGLNLNHIYKAYPNGVKAVNDFCIDIKDKEFIVFVGPSGCGKSTTLRMIAGLEEITAGDLYIDGVLVNDFEPKDRDIAMVFQNYALYPHMTVYENMAFGLRNFHIKPDEINKRVLEAAHILDIEDYLQRKPKEMSGGQRQRVALGRAIVRNPKVFLLDEPLSNLDAKLRAAMRTEITKLHKKLGTTFIYVTHDQVEAMTMGTRIVVMKKGYVQQIDSPTQLYRYPENKFVAGFIGTPQMNFFDVSLERIEDKIKINFSATQSVMIPEKYFGKIDTEYLDSKSVVTLGIRPDNIHVTKKSEASVEFIIHDIEALGNETLLYGDLTSKASLEKITGSSVIVKVLPLSNYEIGQKLYVELVPEEIRLFDLQTEDSILNRIPKASRTEALITGKKLKLFGVESALPEYFASVCKNFTKIQMVIPLKAVIEGNDYKLPIENVEEVLDNKYLITMFDKDSGERVFYLSATSAEVGAEQAFSLELESTVLQGTPKVLSVSKRIEDIDTMSILSRVRLIKSDKTLSIYGKNIPLPANYEALEDNLVIEANLPQEAFKEGTDFSFRIINIEHRDAGMYLTLQCLATGERVFIKSNTNLKVGDDYKLSIDFDLIKFVLVRIAEPLSKNVDMLGKIKRTKKLGRVEGQKNTMNFFITIGDYAAKLAVERMTRITAIEGRSAYSRNYLFPIPSTKLKILNSNEIKEKDEELSKLLATPKIAKVMGSMKLYLKLPIEEIRSYGIKQFAKISIEGKESFVLLPKDFAKKDLYPQDALALEFDSVDCSVFTVTPPVMKIA